MHQYKGRLIVHTGSMFSGKTSSLERDVSRFKIAGYKVMAFKPVVDDRYSKTNIVTHNKTNIEAVAIEDIEDIMNFCKRENPDIVAIDEVQFLKGELEEILNGLDLLLCKGKTIVVAGLDMDFSGKPFEIVKELMPISDYLHKHHAVCVCCGTDAWISNRKIKHEDRIVIGTVDQYEPLCRKCFLNKTK